MTVYDFKPKFQNLLRPLSDRLVRMGVTPNHVTLLACFLSMVVGLALFVRARSDKTVFFLLPIFLFVRMALNAIDGMMAKEHNLKSDFGAYLNEVGDVVSDFFLYLPFAYIIDARFTLTHFIVVIFVFLSIISELVGVAGAMVGKGRRYQGPMGKSDRALVFGILGLLLFFRAPIEPVFFWLFFVLNILLLKTIWNRMS